MTREDHDFGWALEQMRSGQHVARTSWDIDEWITIKGEYLINEDGSHCSFRDSRPLVAVDWELRP